MVDAVAKVTPQFIPILLKANPLITPSITRAETRDSPRASPTLYCFCHFTDFSRLIRNGSTSPTSALIVSSIF